MQNWQQYYDPLNNIWLSSLIAALPILFFFLALTRLRLKGYLAGTITVLIALAVALLFYRMPVDIALVSTVYGFFYGLWPIAWIIVAAVFIYKITVKTGPFDIIRNSILCITKDQRLQMLIVGFACGSFLEGAAGFGSPVAITTALLKIIWLRMQPAQAAGVFGETLRELALPLYSIGVVLVFAFVSNYSGLSTTQALAHTGNTFTFFHHFLAGWAYS